MIDIKFIQFYVESIHNKSIEEYFHVERSTVSNWKKRGMPKRYLLTFIDMEKSNDIFELFERIYLKNKKIKMTKRQEIAIDIISEINTNNSTLETYEKYKEDLKIFSEVLKELRDKNIIERNEKTGEYSLPKLGRDICKNNSFIEKYI